MKVCLFVTLIEEAWLTIPKEDITSIMLFYEHVYFSIHENIIQIKYAYVVKH